MAISTAPDLSGSGRVDMPTHRVKQQRELLLQRERRVELTHDTYLIHGSVGT